MWKNSRPCEQTTWLVEAAKVEMGVVSPLCSENGKNYKYINRTIIEKRIKFLH